MLKFNKKTNTLEQEEYHYELQDVKEPNLYRDIFPYGEVPKISFNWRIMPMSPADEIWITDTTFRDGQQSRPPYTIKQIVDIYKMLSRLSGCNGVIRQSEFFLYSEKDKEALAKCQELGCRYPEITGWIRANKNDFKLVKSSNLKETGILTSVSDYHIFLKLKKTRRQAMDMYLDIVRAALEEKIIPRCHFEDITRADFYGFVVPFAQELMKLSKEAGIPVKIRACDTLGFGVTYPGVSMPRSVNGIMYGLTKFAGVPSEWLEWHGHNDFYRALTNSIGAWLYGCSAANASILGIGERTGNTPTEALVIEYIALKGSANGMDTTVIAELAEYFEKEIGYQIPQTQPYVGKNFNVTKAGIHADGLLKDEEIYNIFDTYKILKRPVSIGITDRSGIAGIIYWINHNLNVKVDKSDPGLLKIKEWIDMQYEAERTIGISDEEMWMLIKKYMPDICGKGK
ncbi:MAG: 2-isopropylmalate synthase [Elusimicrobia bacterium ADurb.Bin231]|nr:MAG: 2-isopropylmalate synthase [Elusimicrobia bacterium ADurb.Bin231]